MKLKTLIEKLREYDPEIEVMIQYYEYWTDSLTHIVKRVQGFSMWTDGKPIWSNVFDSLDEAKQCAEEHKWRDPKFREVLVLNQF